MFIVISVWGSGIDPANFEIKKLFYLFALIEI